jgi:hypothetical protein
LNFTRALTFLVGCFALIVSTSLPGLAQNSQSVQANLSPGPYTIHPAFSPSVCTDVSEGSTANGAVVQAYACNGSTAQSWDLVPVVTPSGAGYEVVSANSKSCLKVSGAANTNGSKLQQWQCLGADETEVWKIYKFGTVYELISMNSGKCMDLTNGNPSNGNQLQQWDCDNGGNPNQVWAFEPVQPLSRVSSIPVGPYLIHPNSNSSSCVDVSGGNQANGTAVQSYSCNGTASQSWSLAPLTGSFGTAYELISRVSGSCLAISGASTADGAKTYEWQCLGASQTSQLWQLYAVGSSYELVSVHSGKCLDLTNGSFQNGNQLQQWDCDNGGNPNQLWDLKSIAPVTATTTTTAQATPTAAVTGQTVVLSGKTSAPAGSPAGNLSFFCDSVQVGTVAADSNGAASVTLPKLSNGSHTLSVQYLGAPGYASSSSSPLQVVVSQPNVGEQAFQADSFVDSVGVQTHLTYNNTGYYTLWPHLLSELRGSGIRHLRDGLWNWGANAPYNAEHQALAAAGIKTTYGISLDYTLTPQMIQNMAAAAGDLEALEAPNECDAGNNCGGGGVAGVNNVVAFMPYLAAAGKLLQVPVVGPSFTIPTSYADAGDLSSKVSYSNLHVYFPGLNPGSVGWGGGDAQGNRYGSIAYWLDQVNQESTLPVQITETGYIAYPSTSTPYTLPESVEASYTPRTLLLAFNHGVKRTFLYELLDEVSSPGYGLLRSDGSEKPAFSAVRALLKLLADPGPTFAPGKLDYTISGGDSTVTHTLLQKRDGSFWLVLWSEQSSYNAPINQPTPVTKQNVVVSISGTHLASEVVTFDATGTATSTTLTRSTQSLPLTLTDQLTLVHIVP